MQQIDLPRPREYGMVTSPRFVQLKQQLLGAILEETRKAMEQDQGVMAPEPILVGNTEPADGVDAT